MTSVVPFPELTARDLEGREVHLPRGFTSARNVVIVAFQRRHQALVDSWVPWLERQAAKDPGLRFYEIPTIGRLWAPARNMIDGGMAAAIKDPVILRRTLTVYGPLRQVMGPLNISNRSTIALFVVDQAGMVRWSGTGGFTPVMAERLAGALEGI